MTFPLDRRQWLAGTGAAVLGSAAAALAPRATAAADAPTADPARPWSPFTLCLNTSTIRGQSLPLDQEVDLAAECGYEAIEPWLGEIQKYVEGGGDLADLRKRIEDRGLIVPSAIGFAQWIVDDDAARAAGLEQARRDMDLVRQIGGVRIAAPPTGATDKSGLDPAAIAARYGALLDIGREIGVTPELEVWGFSKTLSRLGEVVQAAIESGRPEACVLADIYHLHKGGSGFAGLHLLSGQALQVFHVNDYPADPPPATITDAHRVFPGDGVAPLVEVLAGLLARGARPVLSLELFNRDYWMLPAQEAAATGLEKLRAVAAAAVAQA